jgi:hypothetical protein
VGYGCNSAESKHTESVARLAQRLTRRVGQPPGHPCKLGKVGNFAILWERLFTKLVEAPERCLGASTMDVQQSQPVYFNTSPVECHDLLRRMVKVLDLRAKIGSVEAIRSKSRQHAGKVVELRTVELRS